MLPGFRFLFAAIVLSTSMLIFGLGAAALLRAAHEEFASIPTRRPPPETLFAQRDRCRADTGDGARGTIGCGPEIDRHSNGPRAGSSGNRCRAAGAGGCRQGIRQAIWQDRHADRIPQARKKIC